MLISLALIFLFGLLLGGFFKQLHLPSLLGMLIVGIVLGPYGFNLIDSSILDISTQLRQIALIIILTRAGLTLSLHDLKQVGRPAVLMCFLPACCEILGMLLLAPVLLNISLLDAAIMGSVIAAVSPAVVVPRMIWIMENGYGKKKCIPQLVMAGASADDVFVIVLFTAFTSLAGGGSISFMQFVRIPLCIITGIIVGTLIGYFLSCFYKKFPLQNTIKLIILLSCAFLLVALEDLIGNFIPFSGLLAVMAAGMALLKFSPPVAEELSPPLSKIWMIAEILLFVLVGATVDIGYAISASPLVILLVLLVMVFRMAGVFLCLLKSSLSMKERFFCIIAYIPKATVQAAIGGLPLAMGLSCGNIVLTVAVIAILITAPLGALGIDLTYKKLLNRE